MIQRMHALTGGRGLELVLHGGELRDELRGQVLGVGMVGMVVVVVAVIVTVIVVVVVVIEQGGGER